MPSTHLRSADSLAACFVGLFVFFDDGYVCLFIVKEDIDSIEQYKDLETIQGLFEQAQLDESRTCVFWNEYIDLASDTIYEYGKEVE